MLGNLLGGFIVIIVGVALMPTVANLSTGLTTLNNTNVTGASATMVGLITLFYALAIATVGIGVAAQGLKNAGLV